MRASDLKMRIEELLRIKVSRVDDQCDLFEITPFFIYRARFPLSYESWKLVDKNFNLTLVSIIKKSKSSNKI